MHEVHEITQTHKKQLKQSFSCKKMSSCNYCEKEDGSMNIKVECKSSHLKVSETRHSPTTGILCALKVF